MRIYNILKKPVITEKTSNLGVISNCYVFEVSTDATKIDVKKSVLDLYGVEVASVNMLNTREKFKFGKKWAQVKRRSTKKAHVTLKDAKAKIDFSILK